MAVGKLRTDLKLAIELGGLGEGRVGLRHPALGDHRPGDRPVHPGHQRGIAHLRCQCEGELGGLGGTGVGAHVHVGRDDAGVEEQEGVRVVHSGAVQFVEGGLEQVAGVAEFTGEVVGHGTATDGRHAVRQRGVAQPLLGLLEPLARRFQVPGLQGAFAEPKQRGGLLGDKAVRLRLREESVVLLRRDLGLTGGEGALRVGEPQPQVGGEVGGAAGGQFLVRHPEALGDVPERRLGGPHPPGLQGGNVGGRIHGLRQLLLRQPACRTQLLHPAPDDLRSVTLRHDLSMPVSRVTFGQVLTNIQLPLFLLPFDTPNLYVKREIKPA